MQSANIDQGTDAWIQARLGRPTASRMADLMAKTKSGYGASRRNYMMELLCERLTGERQEGFTSAAMMRGTEMEPIARSAYEIETGLIVIETGFHLHPEINLGASPDGLIGDDGLLEIKVPNTAQHVDFLRTRTPDNKYQLQMLCQMACTGREWCDFVSFDDRLPEELQLCVVRFEREEKRIEEMLGEVSAFLEELDDLEAEMRRLITQSRQAA